jgi:hypothetical protein
VGLQSDTVMGSPDPLDADDICVIEAAAEELRPMFRLAGDKGGLATADHRQHRRVFAQPRIELGEDRRQPGLDQLPQLWKALTFGRSDARKNQPICDIRPIE